MTRNNQNVSLGIAHCSLYIRRIALKDDYHKKTMDILAYTSVEFNYLETLADSYHSRYTNQMIQENIFNKAPNHRIAIEMNTKSTFTHKILSGINNSISDNLK